MKNAINNFSSNIQTNFMNSFTFFGFNHTISTWLVVVITLAVILLISYGLFFLFNRYFIEITAKYLRKKYPVLQNSLFAYHRILSSLSHLIPVFIIYYSADLFTIAPTIYSLNMAYTFKSLAIVYMLISLSSTLFDILNLYEHHYSNLTTPNRRPIKGYIQAIKIIIFVLTLILAVSQLLNKSPLYLFTSIGAIAAIILMIFKDQLLGFAANIQIATSDLVRLGDWIELPQFNVDGNVIEISINRIKVRNFDNTIASLPAYALLSNGVKNWRGIKEAGGRRIKQTFYIDSNTVRSCDDLLLQDLKEAKLLAPACSQEFLKGNKADKNTEISLTNLGLFRFYLQHYINSHSQIHDKMTRIVRSYLPTATGIPVELYLFTKETNSASYEAIQAEIFDHILAVLPYFKLATFQYPSATLPDLKPQQFQPVKTYKLKEKAI